MKKSHPLLFFMICITLLVIGIFQYINYRRVIITDYSVGPGKAIYEYVKKNHGEPAANKIKIKDSKKFIDGYGHRFDIYRFKDYTGKDEMVYFFLKQDKENKWSIETIKTMDDFVSTKSN